LTVSYKTTLKNHFYYLLCKINILDLQISLHSAYIVSFIGVCCCFSAFT